jgi:hypothetical protein
VRRRGSPTHDALNVPPRTGLCAIVNSLVPGKIDMTSLGQVPDTRVRRAVSRGSSLAQDPVQIISRATSTHTLARAVFKGL